MEPGVLRPDLDTLPKLLRDRARRLGDRDIAMRVKDKGVWKTYSLEELL